MRILLLCYRFNSLSQRVFCELEDRGHEVSVELDVHPDLTIEAVETYRPDLVLAPFLRRKIPPQVWRRYRTLVVHPGPPGDRGPSPLDWAILKGEKLWGVTLLEATEEYDAGDVWAYRTFPMRPVRKSAIYRNEVTESAVECIADVVEGRVSEPRPQRRGVWRPAVSREVRRVDWREGTEIVLRKIRSGDSQPGAVGVLEGREFHLYNAFPEDELRGEPGKILAVRDEAVCVGTSDGAVWVTHLRERRRDAVKLPAARVLPRITAGEVPLKPWESVEFRTYREIVCEERDGIGYVRFSFYNGDMSTEQCGRLLSAFRYMKRRPLKAVVLLGHEEFFSNGMNLNTIESAESPADESWRNINAMDDLCEEILRTADRLTVAAVQGNAGAGGVFLALTCDLVFAREGVVLNPHYRNIGNLYGSEFWTYTLPRRVGRERAQEIVNRRLPISARRAKELGLIDDLFGKTPAEFREKLHRRLREFTRSADFEAFIRKKLRERSDPRWEETLRLCRERELERMKLNFYGFDTSYHIARYYFVRRYPHFRTPPYLAVHRRAGLK